MFQNFHFTENVSILTFHSNLKGKQILKMSAFRAEWKWYFPRALLQIKERRKEFVLLLMVVLLLYTPIPPHNPWESKI